ncbi:MAG TPA: maltose alpha-D-glucosyltransferase [Chroococcales cyanobacterium]
MIDSKDNDQWYKDAIIYEVHIKSFFDTNDDGYGDFKGLTEKLDYIQSLGVTCIWILPFYPSPLKDDGYDIADYEGVNELYGTKDDFKKFLDEAHHRGLRVITELIINHTSDQHPWFQRARKAPAGSSERSFYVWSDNDQKYKGARIIFTDTEKSNWTYDPVAKAYFWHRFFSHQPDLNYDNPEVYKEVVRVMQTWLDMGVDGMRLDAIPYLIEREGTNCENLPETHDILKKLRKELDSRYQGRFFLAEANQWPKDTVKYFGDGDECQMAYHFPVMPRLYMAVAKGDRRPIEETMANTPAIPEQCQWAMFLRNHDELTLEMVTDEERAYMYKKYAPDPRMRCNVGIRRRLAPLMDFSVPRIQLLNSLLLTLLGTPILYYGDEIGMGDDIWLKDRDGVRTPMQWSADRNGGFSRAAWSKLYSQPINDPIAGYMSVNVESQELNPSSLLNWTKAILKLRKEHPVFGRGTLEFSHAENVKVLSYVRAYKDEKVLIVANLSDSAVSTTIDLAKFKGANPVELLGNEKFPAFTEKYPITLAPYGFYWLKF